MPAPLYLLQVVDAKSGVVAKFPGGGALEIDLIEACVSRLPYAGVLRTHRQAQEAMRRAIEGAILDLKLGTVRLGP